MYFRLMAAIFDFRRAQTLDSIPTRLFVLPDPENMGIAIMTESLNLRHFLSTSCFERHVCYLVGAIYLF